MQPSEWGAKGLGNIFAQFLMCFIINSVGFRGPNSLDCVSSGTIQKIGEVYKVGVFS
jgi:hypothetical protein